MNTYRPSASPSPSPRLVARARKRAVLAALALIASPAAAQTYDSGAAVTPTWTLTPTAPAVGAVLAADSREPADVADSGFTESDWITSGDAGASYNTTPGLDKKFRITCEPSTAKQVDPILGLGVNPFGHRHQGIGNVNWNENSTWNTLRASPSSTCSGSPLNATIYWEPEALKVMSNGLIVGLRPQDVSFYYLNGTIGNANTTTWLRRNFAFIGGQNPSNFNLSALRTEYANAGLEFPGSPLDAPGFVGWQCFNNAGSVLAVTRTASAAQTSSGATQTYYARHLKGPGSTDDPWGGTCTGTTGAPALIVLNLIGPNCWDTVNLRSPDGRNHVRYATRTSDNAHTGLCPDNWAFVPQLQGKASFPTTGFADYGTWYVSSDRMNSFATAGDATSLDPCRVTTGWFCNGATAHFDWMGGYKGSILDEWQRECLGIAVRGVAPVNGPAQCDSSVISKFRTLKYGTSPDTTLSGGCAIILSCYNSTPGNAQRYNPILAGTPATVTISHTHP